MNLSNLTIQPTLWRNIAECSPMSNNNEVVFYTAAPVEEKDITKHIESDYPLPKLVMSRPVFPEEKETNSKYSGPLEDETPIRKVTLFLDAYFQLKQTFSFWLHPDLKETPSKAFARYIGYSYFDCMSGGMPHFVSQILVKAIKSYPDQIDLDTQVYPGKGEDGQGWYTIRDFVENVKSEDPEVNQFLAQIKLPKLLGI